MDLRKGTIKSSPFVGIFAKATNKFVLVPNQIQKKELLGLQDFFQTEIIQASVANSSLIGILAVANSHGIILPGITEEHEANALKQLGLKVKIVSSTNALGNLVAVNDKVGVCSKSLPKETIKEIEAFLKIKIETTKIAESDLVGATLVANDKGFVAHAKATKKEIEYLEKIFNLKGKQTTANYGDGFIAHSIVANNNAALVGLHTTLHEMLRIDDGLSGA